MRLRLVVLQLETLKEVISEVLEVDVDKVIKKEETVFHLKVSVSGRTGLVIHQVSILSLTQLTRET